MKTSRYATELLFALAFVAVFTATAAAHDCSDRSDCSVIPPNVDIATGIAAIGAGGAIGYSVIRRRNGRAATPCKTLRDEVTAGEARIQELEAKVAAARADLERATQAAEQNPDFEKSGMSGPKWIT